VRPPRVGEVDHAGQQALGQAVGDDDGGAGGDGGLDDPPGGRGAQRAHGEHEGADVEHQALDVLLGRAALRRPRDGDRAPHGHAGEPRQREAAGPGAGEGQGPEGAQHDHARPDHDAGDEARFDEVPAREEGEDDRGDQQDRRGEE
jgi:hypothetical protein